MKCLLVHNPYSRRRLKQVEIEEIVQGISVAYTTDIFETQGRGSITEYIAKHPGYDAVLACGGDGTIHEAVCGIMRLAEKPALVILPRGTINDAAKSYGYSKSIKKCIEIIRNGKKRTIPVYSLNDTYMLYGMALGRYSDASYTEKGKKTFGRLAYYFSCVPKLFTSRPVSLWINDKEYRLSQLFLLNTRYLAGYRMDENEGLLMLRTTNRIADTFRFLFFLLSKGKRHREVIPGDTFTLKGNLSITLDGEHYEACEAHISKIEMGIELIVLEK